MEAQEENIVRIGALALNFLVDDAGATVFECTIPPSARVPAPHAHRDVDETLYGLDGVLTVTIDGVQRLLHPGEALFIPRGSVHHHDNPHEAGTRFLAVLTPGSIGRGYFDAIAEVINAPGKPDMDRVKDVMRHHGLVPD